MPRRVSLPGADELFRRTTASAGAHGLDPEARPRPTLAAAPAPVEDGQVPAEPAAASAHPVPEPTPEPAPEPATTEPVPEPAPTRPARTASGRVRHDEKMTVYVTADELLEIEHARLVLRRAVGSAVDRGRLVRAAVAMALADLDERGADSELVRRLSGS